MKPGRSPGIGHITARTRNSVPPRDSTCRVADVFRAHAQEAARLRDRTPCSSGIRVDANAVPAETHTPSPDD